MKGKSYLLTGYKISNPDRNIDRSDSRIDSIIKKEVRNVDDALKVLEGTYEIIDHLSKHKPYRADDVSYRKLWKHLACNKKSKSDLQRELDISPDILEGMEKGHIADEEINKKICDYLKVTRDEIMDFIIEFDREAESKIWRRWGTSEAVEIEQAAPIHDIIESRKKILELLERSRFLIEKYDIGLDGPQATLFFGFDYPIKQHVSYLEWLLHKHPAWIEPAVRVGWIKRPLPDEVGYVFLKKPAHLAALYAHDYFTSGFTQEEFCNLFVNDKGEHFTSTDSLKNTLSNHKKNNTLPELPIQLQKILNDLHTQSKR